MTEPEVSAEHPDRELPTLEYNCVMKKVVFLAAATLCGSLLSSALSPATTPARQVISLNGDWLFQRESATNDSINAESWKAIQVPSSFEQHEGVEFNGVGLYRKSVPAFDLPPGKRALLHFQAAATTAEVWWDGEKLGSHVGGWTPFRFDITELLRKSPAAKAHELRVRLDELVGHNSQGFLPIIAPHFGGIWQGVELLVVPETYANDLRVLAVGDVKKSAFQFEIPLAGTVPATLPQVSVIYRLRGETNWSKIALQATFSEGCIQAWAPLDKPLLWSPATPNLYELQIRLGGADGDLIETRTGFRTIEVFGSELRLNGKPVQLRGVLNWGYSPPLTQPNPGEAVWRQELEMVRGHGFNLVKFCLWIPPQRYHELADEMGVLTWAECPTWHPTLTRKFLEPLRQEFSEFFYYDRNHPSVVLRSLTCETGPGAELPVIQNLYDLAKSIVPGSVVEDDSSWIGWNRVHDFYDDHSYGNNQTWVNELQGFNEYILAHGIKPLVLGEAIAADTWIDYNANVAYLGTNRPWYAPGPLDEVPRWLEKMRSATGPGGLDRLGADSLRYGLLMRKYQAEAFRREVPAGGYVISVVRDFALCSMGFMDYLGKPKWKDSDWTWHRDTMCLLKTEADARSFAGGGKLQGKILLSHFGTQVITNGNLEVTLESGTNRSEVLQRVSQTNIQQNLGTLATVKELNWTLPQVTTPKSLVVRVVLRTAQGAYQNEWPVWLVPAVGTNPVAGVRLHASVSDKLAAELFPGVPRLKGDESAQVVVTARLDADLADRLEKGGHVLMLPDGQKNSFPLNSHWFLRGAPYISDNPLTQTIPREFLLDLQNFDLAGQIIPEIKYMENIDPVLMLWDTHDLKTIKTHGLVFETRIGKKGRLLVSALNHSGKENAAGHWVIQALLDSLKTSALPQNALADGAWTSLKNLLQAESTSLAGSAWRFKPDPKNKGQSQGWHQTQLTAEDGWKDIRIGEAWESQGCPDLDGWAWYRLSVDIPSRWSGKEVFLSFEGVDDFCEVYVNGKLVGTNGDKTTRTSAYSEKKSHNITSLVKAGEKATIAVRVEDWGGAGGIFRPVTLGTAEFSAGVTILK